jgi:hypothetical protein
MEKLVIFKTSFSVVNGMQLNGTGICLVFRNRLLEKFLCNPNFIYMQLIDLKVREKGSRIVGFCIGLK